MAKSNSISDTLMETLTQVAREAIGNIGGEEPQKSKGGLSSGKGLLTGIGLAAAAPLAKKGLDALRDGSLDEMIADLRERVEALGVRAISPQEFAGAGPFDVILELVGGPNMSGNLEALAECGRIAVVGVSAGSSFELDLSSLMVKRGRIHASSLRSRSLEDKAHASRLVERAVLPGFVSGDLAIPVAATYPLDEVEAAYERFAAGSKLGKIVLTL